MKELCYGYYATQVYLPFSSLSRRWRRFSRRVRGKTGGFLQGTRLPEIGWRGCSGAGTQRVWEQGKENGNVRISELGILCAMAADCEDGTNLFEIGTFDGRTSLNLALNSPRGCRVHTLDLPPDTPTKFEIEKGEHHMVDKPASGARYEKYRAINPAAIGRIQQHYGDSASFDYAPFANSCSLVFVDGSHAYDYAISDTEAARAMVRPGGAIVWHDYGIWEGVTRALEEIEEREKLGLRNIRGTSLVYWRKESREPA